MVVVAVTAEQPPEAAMVLVMVYVPTKLDKTLISPVAGVITTPAGLAENVPATPPPLKTGVGFTPPLLQ